MAITEDKQELEEKLRFYISKQESHLRPKNRVVVRRLKLHIFTLRFVLRENKQPSFEQLESRGYIKS